MRKGLPIAALLATCALVAPAAATAQCGPPKGVYLANAELANELYLFVGQAGDSLSGPGSEVLSGNLRRGAAFSIIAAGYPLKVLRAMATEPPQCGARQAPAPRTRRASAVRRR